MIIIKLLEYQLILAKDLKRVKGSLCELQICTCPLVATALQAGEFTNPLSPQERENNQ